MRPDPSIPEAWLAYAHSDLALAAATVPGVMREHLSFHAQQAAEKSLKAVLIARKIAFPKTHSIKLLIEQLPADIERTPALLDAVALTEYATVFRYPGEVESSLSPKRNIDIYWP
jgi:HEPN domain-containing protein